MHWKPVVRFEDFCFLGVLVLAIGVYTATMAPTAGYFDSAELITAAHVLGIPHQPGMPLYVLIGRCFDLLLAFLSTAQAVNFMSAVFGGLGVALTYRIVLEIARQAGAGPGWLAHAGGLVGALFLLFSDTCWRNSTEAEVYSLSTFAVALITWLILRWHGSRRQPGSDALLYLVLYLLGLGVGFHLGVLLAYPAVFLTVVQARDRRLPLADFLWVSAGLGLFLLSTLTSSDSLLIMLLIAYAGVVVARAWTGHPFALVGTGFFALGLSVHLFMLIRAGVDPALNYSQPDDLGTLMSCLRRDQYPPLSPFARQAPLGWQFSYYYGFLIRQFAFLGDGAGLAARLSALLGPLLLGIAGLWHCVRRAKPWAWALIAGYLANAEILNFYLNFTDHEVRERDYFFASGYMYAAVLIGLGAVAVLRSAARLRRRQAGARRSPRVVDVAVGDGFARLTALVMVLVAASPLLVPGHPKWVRHDRSSDWIARDYAWNTLATVDENAILVTNADNDTFPLWYLQFVEGLRRDVSVLNLQLANLPWYVRQLRRRDPGLPVSSSDQQVEELAAHAGQRAGPAGSMLGEVADRVLRDVLTTNAGREHPRPVFFSVTIPKANLPGLYRYLRSEGLAFRLTRESGPDELPDVDAERILQNMYGAFEFRSLLTGDSKARRQKYLETAESIDAAGAPASAIAAMGPKPAPRPIAISYAHLVPSLGEPLPSAQPSRWVTGLPANYGVAAARAGRDFLLQAREAPVGTDLKSRLLDRALAATELARRLEPSSGAVGDLHTAVLVESGRVRDAIAYLETRIADAPHDPSAYRALFAIARAAGDHGACREISERWRRANRDADSEMAKGLAELEPLGE